MSYRRLPHDGATAFIMPWNGQPFATSPWFSHQEVNAAKEKWAMGKVYEKYNWEIAWIGVKWSSSLWTRVLHIGRWFWLSHPPKGGEPMRITFHIGTFTVTIIVRRRKNHHSGKWWFRLKNYNPLRGELKPLVAVLSSCLYYMNFPNYCQVRNRTPMNT